MARACGDRASQLLLVASVTSTSASEVCGGLVSVKFSRWCSIAVLRVERVSSARSFTVSAVAYKKAVDSTYTMGIER